MNYLQTRDNFSNKIAIHIYKELRQVPNLPLKLKKKNREKSKVT